MTDNHVHIGWYTDGYHKSLDVLNAEKDAGIDEIVVSSTSTCAELYKLVVKEMRELIRIGGSRIHPLLWLTPRMMKTWGIRYMLHSKIQWQGIKMHWQAHREWFYNRKLLLKAMNVARQLDVPVLFHTGNFKECHANVFLEICKCYEDLKIVLAHGNPIDETIEVLSQCNNTYVDTAFMPVENIHQLCEAGFCDRILFGTDAPINMLYYKDITTAEYIKKNYSDIKTILGSKIFNLIMSNKVYLRY